MSAKGKWPKERQMYRETYYKGACTFKPNAAPTFRHLAPGCKMVDSYVMAAGQVKRTLAPGVEEQLEYQDIRVYFSV